MSKLSSAPNQLAHRLVHESVRRCEKRAAKPKSKPKGKQKSRSPWQESFKLNHYPTEDDSERKT